MSESTIKKLPLKKILIQSWNYCRQEWRPNLVFSGIAYVLGCMLLWTSKSLLFLPVLVGIYVLWGGSFRYYLNRRPIFEPRALFYSLVPSTKIVVMSVIIGAVLVLLPWLPFFLNLSPDFYRYYAMFMHEDLLKGEGVFVLVANIVFVLLSPMIAYRPFLAWISALTGRSGSLGLAWDKTKGNYCEFLLIAVITNLSVVCFRWIVWRLGGNDYITLLVAAPLVIYFNVLSAKAYEFFFLDIDTKKQTA
jgi:hypothetical protein